MIIYFKLKIHKYVNITFWNILGLTQGTLLWVDFIMFALFCLYVWVLCMSMHVRLDANIWGLLLSPPCFFIFSLKFFSMLLCKFFNLLIEFFYLHLDRALLFVTDVDLTFCRPDWARTLSNLSVPVSAFWVLGLQTWSQSSFIYCETLFFHELEFFNCLFCLKRNPSVGILLHCPTSSIVTGICFHSHLFECRMGIWTQVMGETLLTNHL